MVERRIGRLLQENQRAAKMFDIMVWDNQGKIKVSWKINENQTNWSLLSEGCYLLSSNIRDWSSEEV